MLHLLRNIRRKLLTKNKFSSYLLYGVGEILLVVIGILIAIQIGDWNEDRKKDKLERKILQEIQVDLQTDLKEIEDEIESYSWIAKGDSILEQLYYSGLPFTDSIGGYIYGYEISPHFNPIDGGYQLLKAKGIDLTSNDSLRQSITGYYEQSIPYYLKYESERIYTTLNEMIPFNNEHFYMGRINGFPYWKRLPYDEQMIRKNQKWLSLIQKSLNLASVLTSRAKYHKYHINHLLKMIEVELTNSKNK